MRLLSPHQIDQFRNDGFLVVENLLDFETVEILRQRFEHLFRGEFETGISPDEVNWQVGESDPSLTRQICNGWKADFMIARTVFRTDLGRGIALLGNWPGTRLFQDNLLWKPPGARPIGLHQDNAYVGWLTPQEIVSCWMALDDTQAQGGTLELVRGSHRWAHSQPDSTFHGPQRYREAMEQAATIEGIAPDIVSIEIPCGSASLSSWLGLAWLRQQPHHFAEKSARSAWNLKRVGICSRASKRRQWANIRTLQASQRQSTRRESFPDSLAQGRLPHTRETLS